MIVVVEFGTSRSLGWTSSTGGTSQEILSPKIEQLALRLRGLAEMWVCSESVSIVEVYQRHAALDLRRITGK
jgi:hypothetical protein